MFWIIIKIFIIFVLSQKHIITMTKLRAVATITLYVYGENEKQLINEAKQAANKLNNLDQTFDAGLEQLQLKNFGSLEATDIDFNKKMTFEEFVGSRQYVLKKDLEDKHGYVIDSKACYLYDEHFIIEDIGEGEYNLVITNSDYTDTNLKALERRLWDDFAREEINGYDE